MPHSNAHSAVLSWWGGGYPIVTWVGGTPSLPAREVLHPDLAKGLPKSWLGGVPYPDITSGLPPTWDWGSPHAWDWVPPPPGKGDGTSHWGIPLKGHGKIGSIMGWRWGTPSGCEQTDTCENSTFLILRMRAVTT